jgi:hypothetical protein
VKPRVPAVDRPAPVARRWPWLLLALSVILMVAMLLLRWLLQPERLGALLVERAERATGLDITVSQPARLGVWPGLQLELIGLDARLPRRPALLVAARVDIALPLALLWGGELEIGALALRTPRFDLVEWRRWRDAGFEAGPPAPPALPELAAAVRVDDGMLLGDGWQLANIDLDASALRDGLPFSASGKALLLLSELALPARFSFGATPIETGQAIELRELILALGGPGSDPALKLDGEAAIGIGQLQLQLTALVSEEWPTAWPALPAWTRPHVTGRPLQLAYAGGADFDGSLQLRDDASVFTIDGNPRQLFGWAGADDASPLPPLAASAQLERLELDGVVIEGLKVGLEELPTANDD